VPETAVANQGSDVLTGVDELIKVESRLTRSFFAAAAGFLAVMLFIMFVARRGPTGAIEPASVFWTLVLVQYVCYVWYAISAGRAAKALREPGWKYVVWILVAPFLANLPIPVISTLIGVSPLAIRFLLGGRIQTAIRDASVADLHGR
jgi:hypothetical protein